jgi:transcriptional regulator with XRE-family HTH domain
MIDLSTPNVVIFDRSRTFIPMTDEELAAIIGRNVRAARTAAGLTQGALSEKTGLAAPNISRLEAGTHLPSVATLKKVADTLQVPICSLLDPPAEVKPADEGGPKKKGKGK